METSMAVVSYRAGKVEAVAGTLKSKQMNTSDSTMQLLVPVYAIKHSLGDFQLRVNKF